MNNPLQTKWFVTTDNAGAIPAHFRPLQIACDDGYLVLATMAGAAVRAPYVVAAAQLMAAAPVLRDALNQCFTPETSVEFMDMTPEVSLSAARAKLRMINALVTSALAEARGEVP